MEFVDDIVGSGKAPSRGAVVTRALERERRRAIAEYDAEILSRAGPDPELAGLAEYAGTQIGILLDRHEPAFSNAIRPAFDLD
jgi:hypothetical protein